MHRTLLRGGDRPHYETEEVDADALRRDHRGPTLDGRRCNAPSEHRLFPLSEVADPLLSDARTWHSPRCRDWQGDVSTLRLHGFDTPLRTGVQGSTTAAASTAARR